MLTSQSSALWLASVFRRMVGSVASMNLTADPEVDVDDVESLELRRAEKTQGKQLRREGRRAALKNYWMCTDEQWLTNAALLDPFVEGRSGHQYLTSEATDDAVVTVSFNEPDVLLSGWSKRDRHRGADL